MVDPFPPQQPPPPPPQQPGNVPSPAFPQQPMQPAFGQPAWPGQPPAQKSGGCFKGCCIVGVIVGVLGIIGAVVFALNFKKFISWTLVKGVVDQSDLNPDEKKEAADLMEKFVDAGMSQKIKQSDFQKIMDELGATGNDNKVEAKELRPIFGRMKKLLRDAGYSFPSELFTKYEEVSVPGNWSVTVRKIPSGKKSETADVVARKKGISADDAKAELDSLPATVLLGVSEVDARRFADELRQQGCEVEVTER